MNLHYAKSEVQRSRDAASPHSWQRLITEDWLELWTEIKRLQARNELLGDSLSFMTTALDPAQSDETDDWEITDVRWRLRINEMQATIAKLPKTADGVPVVPGMELVSTYYGQMLPDLREVVELRDGAWRFEHSQWHEHDNHSRACYSTREAAEAKKE